MYYAIWLRTIQFACLTSRHHFSLGNKSSLPLPFYVSANLERHTEWNTVYNLGFRMYHVDHHREWTMQISLQEASILPPTSALCLVFSLSTTVHSTTSSLRKLPTLCELPLILINVTGVDVVVVNVTSRVSRSLSMHPSKTVLIRYSCLRKSALSFSSFFFKVHFTSLHRGLLNLAHNARGSNYRGYMSE